ncbi:MAG: glycosyl hydrolase 53 family protein [Spirosomataceae bacterium]
MKLFFLRIMSWLLFCLVWGACQPSINAQQKTVYLGADLSYVNEMEDCGGVYRSNQTVVEPYSFFSQRGANLVRIRLWHTPTWTRYSTLSDVKKSIRKAKQQQMAVLLDFHYSDTWADPAHQTVPKAWSALTNQTLLGDSVYQYTLVTLLALHRDGLLPEMVQVGNEINTEILQFSSEAAKTMNWTRNVYLLNRGIAAVKQAAAMTNKPIGIMLHIAQPDDALAWFTQAHQAGIADYDWIGLSYYPKWSTFSLAQLGNTIATLIQSFKKRVMIVETAYPYTLQNADAANNLLDGGLNTYPISPEGQLQFLVDLTKTTLSAGGEGVIYWEPAWISTGCSTGWGIGSHWDNATFFDASRQNEALPAFGFFDQRQYR